LNPNEGSTPSSLPKKSNVIYETEGQKIEGKNPRKGRCHAALTAWHLYSPKLMVEARGIEPLSENSSELLSTGVFRSFISPASAKRTKPIQGSVFMPDRYKR